MKFAPKRVFGLVGLGSLLSLAACAAEVDPQGSSTEEAQAGWSRCYETKHFAIMWKHLTGGTAADVIRVETGVAANQDIVLLDNWPTSDLQHVKWKSHTGFMFMSDLRKKECSGNP
jgi:hypothetical protein